MPTATSTATIQPTMPTPTPTSQSIATETVISIPTPPGESRMEQVLWLYETNNGCQLPCWWGITPGQTEWSVAEEFLYRFDSNYDIYESSPIPRIVYYGVSVILPQKVFSDYYTELGVLVIDGVVDTIETDVSIGDTPPGSLSQYTLSAFLSNYGEPTEVWLATYRSSPGGGPGSGGILSFVVVLFYPEQGIAALYDDLGEIADDIVRGCPQEYPVSTLKLWSPNTDFTFEQLVSSSSSFNLEYLSLEESTEMDVTTFYETFKKPDNTTCLETPTNLWR
jgi:hypothetical protein